MFNFMYIWLSIMLNLSDRICWSQWSLDSVGPKTDKTGIGCIFPLLSPYLWYSLIGWKKLILVFFFFLNFCFNWSFGIFYILTHFKWLLENWNDLHVSKNICNTLKFKLRMKIMILKPQKCMVNMKMKIEEYVM